MSEQGESVLQRAQSAFDEQSSFISIWRDAASYCLPRKVWNLNYNGNKDGRRNEPYIPDPKLQNAVAVKAAQNLAAGMCSAFMNASDIWAQWEPSDFLPEDQKTDELYGWYANATRITMRLLGPAGFYSRGYETVLDSVGIGTGFLDVQGKITGSTSPLNFSTWDIGTYAIAENCAGFVDRVWRRVPYTVAQAKQKFPGFNPRTRQSVRKEDESKKEEYYTLEIMPRDERDVGQTVGNKGMPFRSVIVHDETKEVVSEGGFDEFPGCAYRFNRQSGLCPWGTGPGIDALPEARGINFMDAALADGIGKSVDPPLVIKDDMRGVLDARMGGVSSVSNLQTDMPQRLMGDVGNIGFGVQFQEGKKRELRDIFYNDLFTPFLNDRRTLKAAQVDQIARDVINVFAPFGHRFLEEFVTQVLERIFMILLRQGLFGPVPREAFARNSSGGYTFLYPKTVHQSRMALEIQNLSKANVRQLIQDFVALGQVRPDALDWLNVPQMAKLLGANSVVMPNILISPEEYSALQISRQQAAQQEQREQMVADFATKNPQYAAAALANVS